MKLQQLLDICKFNRFPFDFKPHEYPQIWVDQKELLKELIHFRDTVIINELSEFGIITGLHGSGKSHALFHTEYLVNSIQPKQSCFTVYVDNPTGLGTKGTFVENYTYIIRTGIGNTKAKRIFTNANEIISDITSANILTLSKTEQHNIIRNPQILEEQKEKTYNEIVGKSPISFKTLKLLADMNEDAWEWISALSNITYLNDENVQPLTSHIICAKTLSTIIKLATIRDVNGKPSLYNSMFLFVDQAEDLANLKAGSFQEQIVGWRTLIDETDSHFGMLWAMDGSAEDISANVTDAIQRRVNLNSEKLRLLDFEDSDAKQFLIEVMQHFRISDENILSKTYPFEEEALDEIVTKVTPRIPSFLLIACRNVFLKVAERDLINSLKDVITKEMVLEFLS